MAVIGNMRQKGALQNNTPIAYGAGKKDSYAEVATAWGQLKKQSSARVNELGDTTLASNWTWECRFNSDLENLIGKSSRWVIENRFFTITGYEQIDQRRFWYKFFLSEVE